MTEQHLRTIAENARRAHKLATQQPEATRAAFAPIHADLKAQLSAENRKRNR